MTKLTNTEAAAGNSYMALALLHEEAMAQFNAAWSRGDARKALGWAREALRIEQQMALAQNFRAGQEPS